MRTRNFVRESHVFLSKLNLNSVLEVYGDLDIKSLEDFQNIPEVLLKTFGDYIIKT